MWRVFLMWEPILSLLRFVFHPISVILGWEVFGLPVMNAATKVNILLVFSVLV